MTTPVPWHDFSSDPRRPESASLRASDRDRAVVLGVLGEAYADGRLTREEHDDRSTRAAQARTLGELPPLLADLVPMTGTTRAALDRGTTDAIQAQAVRHWERQRREAVNGLLFIAVVTGVIWLVTSGPGSFPWPVFPILFVGMRLLQVQLDRRDMIDGHREKLERKRLEQLEKRRDENGDDEPDPS